MYTVERHHDISCGHRVHGHESKCAHFHGHNYRITFTCAKQGPAAKSFPSLKKPAELDSVGRVIDFSVIKATLCEFLENEWDHKMLLWIQDPAYMQMFALDPHGTVGVPFNPTAENMAEYLVMQAAPLLLKGTGVQLIACKVEETRKCSATYLLGGA